MSLCLSCGLCCDGTLFARARLVWSEAERLPLLGLPVLVQDDGSLFLTQPCQALDGARCRIYADRPRTCREYACDLADALAGNELDLAVEWERTALGLVHREACCRPS